LIIAKKCSGGVGWGARKKEKEGEKGEKRIGRKGLM